MSFTGYIRCAILLLKRLARLVVIILAILAFGFSIIALGITQQSQVLAILSFQSATSTVYISQWNLDFTWFLGDVFKTIGGLVCFFGIVRLFIKYKFICKNFGLGKVTVALELPLWKRIFLLNIPPNWGEVKFQISYRNTDNSFPTDCFWGGGKGLWLLVNEPIQEKLQIWHEKIWGEKNSILLRLDNGRKLPDNLEFEIRLVKRNGQVMLRYADSYYKLNS